MQCQHPIIIVLVGVSVALLPFQFLVQSFGKQQLMAPTLIGKTQMEFVFPGYSPGYRTQLGGWSTKQIYLCVSLLAFQEPQSGCQNLDTTIGDVGILTSTLTTKANTHSHLSLWVKNSLHISFFTISLLNFLIKTKMLWDNLSIFALLVYNSVCKSFDINSFIWQNSFMKASVSGI